MCTEKSASLVSKEMLDLQSRNFLSNDRIIINISGALYETQKATLNHYPHTLLGSEQNRKRISGGSNKILLHCNRLSFDSILFFYQSRGKLIRPTFLPMHIFEADCKYFRIPDDAIQQMRQRENFIPHKTTCSMARLSSCGVFLNFPRFSLYKDFAMLYSLFNYSLIMLSVFVFCVEEELKIALRKEEVVDIVEAIEVALNSYFSVEYCFRFVTFSSALVFLSDCMNILDAMSIFPYFVVYALPKSNHRLYLMSVVRLVRILRLYRLGHISAAVRAAGDVAKATVHELISVIFFFIMACIMFGTIIYIIEAPTNSVFASIPDSMWWSWQTMFCLGYGDIVPTSLIGKIVASWLTIFGIIIIAALIISLGGRFFEIYKSILEYEIHSIG